MNHPFILATVLSLVLVAILTGWVDAGIARLRRKLKRCEHEFSALTYRDQVACIHCGALPKSVSCWCGCGETWLMAQEVASFTHHTLRGRPLKRGKARLG